MSRKDDTTNRKLIDRILPKVEDGALVGFLATSYELQSDFFETDFLPSLLGIGAWDDRSWASRIAMERALAQMESAVVFLDARRYGTRPHSFRVAVQTVAMTNGGAFHPKITLFVHEDVVRLVIGSANLTTPGYRKNREGVTLLRATPKQPAAAPLISDAIVGLRSTLAPCWNAEAERVCAMAMERLQSMTATATADARLAWTGPGIEPLWRQFVAAWPPEQVIDTISIVSPFWSEEQSDKDPFSTFLSEWRRRGVLKPGCGLRLLTEAQPNGQTSYRPVLPESFARCDLRRYDVRATAQAVDPVVDPNEIETAALEGVIRPLHAKVVVVENKTTALAYVGSANFTAHGWGFIGGANVEAGVFLLRTGRDRAVLTALIPPTTGAAVELSGAAQGKIGSPNAPEPEPPWPSFVRSIMLQPSPNDPACLVLAVEIAPKLVEGPWQISAGSDLLWSGKQDDAPSLALPVGADTLHTLLTEKEVRVRWWVADVEVGYPINISLEARARLPFTPGTTTPNESSLLAYYQGRVTWEELFPDPIDGRHHSAKEVRADEKRADTSRIQSYQIREFVEALRGIEDELKAASASNPAAMRLAVLGPVSPVSLARQVAQETRRDRSPVAAGFQLIEILCCLGRARLHAVEGPKGEAWLAVVSQGITEVERILQSLQANHPERFATETAFFQYSEAVAPMFRTGASQ